MGFEKRSARAWLQGKARPAWVAAGLMMGAQMGAHAAGPTVAVRFGLAAPLAATTTASVPTMSQWAMLAMAVLLAVVGAHAIRRKGHRKALASVALFGAALAAGWGGSESLIRAAHADTAEPTFYPAVFIRDTDISTLAFWFGNSGGQGQGSSAVIGSSPLPETSGVLQVFNSTSQGQLRILDAYFSTPADSTTHSFSIDTESSTCTAGAVLLPGDSCTVVVGASLIGGM